MDTMHDTSLHCTRLHCTALHCNSFHYIQIHHTKLHYTLLHCPTVHCTTTNYTQLHATLLSIVLSSLPRLFHKGYRREVPLVVRLPLMRALAWRHIVSRMHGRPVHRCALQWCPIADMCGKVIYCNVMWRDVTEWHQMVWRKSSVS